jgi:hypothetical protein
VVLSVHLSLFSTVDKRTTRRRKSVDPWRALVREIIKRYRMIGSFQVQKMRLYEKDHQGERRVEINQPRAYPPIL